MKFVNSNKVNLGIALALFGILFFSLMSSVEGLAGNTAIAKKTGAKKMGAKKGNIVVSREPLSSKKTLS